MPHRKTFAPWIGLASLACALSAMAGTNSWTRTGPDSGWVTAIEIHPTNPQISLAATPGGLYRTSDGGANWVQVNEDIHTPRNMAFDPTNPSRVFVAHANSDLWVSNDAGATFALANAPEFGVRQVEFSSAGVLYVLMPGSRMFKSTNQGVSWTACSWPWGVNAASNVFTVDPNNNPQDHLFMEVLLPSPATNGTWRSFDGCTTWTMTGTGSPASGTNEYVNNYSVMPTNPDRVLASTNLGIKRSTDGGDTWDVVTAPPHGTVDPGWWVEYDRASPGKAVAMVEIAHVLRSTDGGDNWTYAGNLAAPENTVLALDPQNSNRMLVGTQNGLYQSTDNGSSFVLRNRGMRSGEVSDLSVADDGTVYASFYPGAGGVFRRDPSNGAWAPVNNSALWSATIASRFHVSHIATAPGDSSLLYVGNYFGSLTRSNDAGNTWQQSHQAFMNVGAVPSDTAVDPDDALVAYTASSNQGMWKTIDGGVSWIQASNGLPLGVRVVAAARNSDVVYAAAEDPNTLFPGKLYRSTNAGASWALTGATPVGIGEGWFNDIVIDPKNPDVVYAPFHFGVYKTTNGGASWALMTFPGVSAPPLWALSLAIDAKFSSTLILSRLSDGALARTVDGGVNWERIALPPGVIEQRLNRAVFNPVRPGQIIAGMVVSGIGEYDVATDLAVINSGLPFNFATSSNVSGSIGIENRGPHAASPSQATITLPAWITPNTPNGCTRNAQTLTCDVPALQVGQVQLIPLSLAISASGGTGSITTSLTTHETDPVSTNNTMTLSVVGSERADLGLTLTPSAVTLDRGDSTTVTASIVNRGPNPSTSTVLTLEVPAGLSVQTITPSSPGNCAQVGADFQCAFGTMAVNATASVALQLTAVAKGGHSVVGRLDGAGIDTNSDQFDVTEIGVRAVGDVSVTLVESADPVTVGTPLGYTATLRNLSGDSANVQFQLGVGGTTGASIASIDAVGIACSFDNLNVHCTGLDFAAGGTATVTVNVNASSPGIIITGANVSYGGTDTNTDNNSASIGTTLRLVGDISVEIADSADPVPTGPPFTYTVTVRNTGPNAGPVSVSIPVTGGNVSEATSAAGTCAIAPLAVNCNLASLANGAAATIVVTAFAATPGTVSATATATFVGVDPDPSNNSATAETLARAVTDVGVTISESADPITAGTVLSYVVSVSNAGPSEANVHLVIPVTGGTVTGATPSQGGTCSIAAGTVTCDFNPLSFSPSTVDLVLNSTTAGTVTATVTATSSGTDPVAANDTATASTTVNAAASSSSSSGGGSSGGGGSGGGGGRFDWLALLLLGGVLAGRARLRVPALR